MYVQCYVQCSGFHRVLNLMNLHINVYDVNITCDVLTNRQWQKMPSLVELPDILCLNLTLVIP